MIGSIEDQIRRDEGLRLSAYSDSLGFLTIGYGHCIDARKNCAIPQLIAENLLQVKLDGVKAGVDAVLPWAGALDGPRLGVLWNMAYQMGAAGLLEFRKMLACVQAKDFAGAAAEMKASLWYTQTPARAARLCVQMETGVWQ